MDLLGDIVGFMDEPIPSFFFDVLVLEEFDIDNPLGMASAVADLATGGSGFQSISGLELSFSTGTHQEAGWSTPRPLFEKMNNSEVTMIRYLRPRHVGVMGFSFDSFSGWCQDTFSSAKTWESPVVTKDILIFVYHPSIKNPLPVGPASFPVAGFLLQEAYPTKWSISDLDSLNDSDPIKETIGFQFTEIQRLAVPPA